MKNIMFRKSNNACYSLNRLLFFDDTTLLSSIFFLDKSNKQEVSLFIPCQSVVYIFTSLVAKLFATDMTTVL